MLVTLRRTREVKETWHRHERDYLAAMPGKKKRLTHINCAPASRTPRFLDLPSCNPPNDSRIAEASADSGSNRERAQGEVEEVSRLRSLINPLRELERESEDFEALQQLATEESDRRHAQTRREIATEHARLLRKLEEFELRQFFGENDPRMHS